MKTKIIATLVVVLGLGGFAYYKMQGTNTVPATTNNDTTSAPKETTNPNPVTTTPTPVTTPADTTKNKYKNGTYTATGNYRAPSGDEQVSITLIIKNDKVVGATSDTPSGNRTAKRFQQAFSDGFSGYVVGKSIDSIKLSVVNGASLTPNGFMDALSQIQSQAKA